MPAQQQLFTDVPPPDQPPNQRVPGAPRPEGVTAGEGSRVAPAPVWLQRLSLVVLVVFCFYIGTLLTLLPWWPRYWAQNGWIMGHPAVNAVLQLGWVRGVVSGVGVLDVWTGISEVVHYRDYRA